MGNADSINISEAVEQDRPRKGRFVINFISASDIPSSDFISTCDPYLKAYLCKPTPTNGEDGRPQYIKVSDVVKTPRKSNCNNPVWNCYRDFRIDPPEDTYLVVELYDWNREKLEKDPLGSVVIGLDIFSDENPHSFFFDFHKVGNAKKNPNFSVILRRAYISRPAPEYKTIFLLRHGESKWNKAQASGNMLTTLLDRDHALTERGVKQASSLNRKWKEEYENILTSLEEEEEEEDLLGTLTLDTTLPEGNTTSDSQTQPTTCNTIGPDSPGYEADLLGLGENSEYNDGKTSKSTITNDFWSSPGHMSPVPTNSLASSPGFYGSVLQAFSNSDYHVNPNPNPNDDPFSSTNRAIINAYMHTNNVSTSTIENDLNTVSYDDFSRGPLTKYENFSFLTINTTQNTVESDAEDDGDEDENENNDTTDNDNTNNDTTDNVITEDNNNNNNENHLNFIDMVVQKLDKKYNKPLSLNEIKERRKLYEKMFIQSDYVYCSPLTRAIETALLSLEGHKALESHGLILNSNIREIKGVGGLDSVGVACGNAIIERVANELEVKIGRDRTEQVMLDQIHVNDAINPWWTNISSFDNKQDQYERLYDFISFTRYCEGDTPIFVGHSLFFKLFYSRKLSHTLNILRPNTSQLLRTCRLANATVLAVTILYDQDSDFHYSILDAEILFRGNFAAAGKHKDSRNNYHDPSMSPLAHNPNTNEKKLTLSSVFEKAQSILQNGLFDDDLNSTNSGGVSGNGGGVSNSGAGSMNPSLKESRNSQISNTGNSSLLSPAVNSSTSIGTSISDTFSSLAKKVEKAINL